jgi:hypothetical protein
MRANIAQSKRTDCKFRCIIGQPGKRSDSCTRWGECGAVNYQIELWCWVRCLWRNSCKSWERYCAPTSNIKRVSCQELCWGYWSQWWWCLNSEEKKSTLVVVLRISWVRACAPQIVPIGNLVPGCRSSCEASVDNYLGTISCKPVRVRICLRRTVPCLSCGIKIS